VEPQYGIINMNARLYDPALARMLSPDNLVSDPTNTQAFNRYSYVWNNPMKYTDPSGNDLISAIGGAIGNVISAIQQVTTTASRFCNGTVASSSSSSASPLMQGIGGGLSFLSGVWAGISAGQAGKAAGDRVNGALGGGSKPTDVIVRGPSAQGAVDRLNQTTQLDIQRDKITGKLTANGKAQTPAERELLKAINDPLSVVDLYTDKSNISVNEDGTLSSLLPGAYKGSEVDETGTVTGQQLVNIANLDIIAAFNQETSAETLMHEINESYLGTKLDPGGDYKSGYQTAHNAAAKLDRVPFNGYIFHQDTINRTYGISLKGGPTTIIFRY
jgi:RHS repeat-associated protein